MFHQFKKTRQFPDDLDVHIFSFLSLSEQKTQLTQVNSNFFHSVKNRNSLLAKTYINEFGAVPFGEEIAEQLHAAFLYRKITEELHPNHRAAHLKKFTEFLNQHKEKPWAKYYWAMLSRGDQFNLKTIGLLANSLVEGDYRAAMSLVNELINASYVERLQIFTILKPHRAGLVLSCLQTTLEKPGGHVVLRTLGHLYWSGLIVEVDLKEAEKYFQLAVEKNDAKAACDLADFYLEDEEKPTQENVTKTIHFLENTFQNLSSPLIARKLGNLYRRHGEEKSHLCRKWFVQAFIRGDGVSAQALAELYLHANPEKAKKWFLQAFDHGVASAARILAWHIWDELIPGSRKECIELLKRGFRAGDEEALRSLVDQYHGYGKKTGSSRCWWLLKAFALDDTLPVLSALNQSPNSHAKNYAWKIISIMRFPLAPFTASNIDAELFENFIAKGKTEGLQDEKIDAVIEKIKESLAKPTPISSMTIS